MASATDYARMQGIVEGLDAEWLQASSTVESWTTSVGSWFIGTGASQDANRTLLATLQSAITRLRTTLYSEVIAGYRSVEAWTSHAKDIHDQLQSIAPDLGNWTFGGVVGSTASATATEVKQGATVGLAIATPILLLVGGLYVFILLGPMLRRGG